MGGRKILCFQNDHLYRKWLERNSHLRDLGMISIPSLIKEEGDKQGQTDFLKAYVDTVGQLSAHNHSLLWWATDISSKNYFLSPLMAPLEKFFRMMHFIEQASGEMLIFVGVDWYLERSLRNSLGDRGVVFLWYGRQPNPCFIRMKQLFLLWGRVIRHILYILPRIILARILLAPALAKVSADQEPVYLVKTFIKADSFDGTGAYKDMFFGSLIDFLVPHRRVIILADVVDDFSKTLALISRFGQKRIYPLESFLTGGDVLHASKQMLNYSIRMPARLDFAGYDVEGLVSGVCRDGGNKIQPLHLWHYYVMARVLKHFKLDVFTFPCEFNPWEKMCLWAIKQYAPAIRTLGYQHTVVPQASPNMFASGFEEDIIPKPDQLLTVGQRPKEIIHRYETCTPSAIQPACGLRFDYLFGQPQSRRANRGHILLALEGLPQVVEVTNYVLNELNADSKYRLRIRTHPVFPLDKFVGRLAHDPRRMRGVEITQESSLQEDLVWADIVVYWGSAVSLEAVSIGKPVIHYDTGSLLSADPLFELKDFKWVAHDALRLVEIIDSIYGLSDEDYQARFQAAKAYIAAYCHQITPQALSCFEV